MGIALAPDFETSGWIYLSYSALPLESLTQRVSRFQLDENGDLDMESEQARLRVDPPARDLLPLGGRARVRPRRQPPDLDGRQHQPVRVAGLRADRRAGRPPVLRRPADRGEHQRPQRQAAPDHPRGDDPAGHRARDRGHLRDPGGEHVPGRHRGHPAGDLRDGLPEPVPVQGRRGDRLVALGRLWPRCRRGEPRPRPAGQRRVQRHHRAGQLRLAVLRPAEHPVHRLDVPERPGRRRVRLRGAGQRIAQQHRAYRPPAGRAGDDVDGLLGHRRPIPRAGHGRRPDGGPALLLRSLESLADQVPGGVRRQVVHRGVEQRLDQDRRARRGRQRDWRGGLRGPRLP